MKFIILLMFVSLTVNASTLKGVVESSKCKGPFQIWISQGKTLIYQAEVPLKGSFEFSLNPGKYDIAATSFENCRLKKSVDLKKGKSRAVKLVLP